MLALLLALALGASSGCAHREAIPKETIEAKAERLDELAKARLVTVDKGPYIGAKRMGMRDLAAPVLQTHVTIRKKGTLGEVCDVLRGLVPVHVNLAADTDMAAPAASPAHEPPVRTTLPQKGQPEPQDDPARDLEALLAAAPMSGGSGSAGGTVALNYSGTLMGILNHMSAQSGFGWDYDRTSNTVTFARQIVRTFTVLAVPGQVDYETQYTDRSKDNASSGTIGGGSVGSTVTTQDTMAQTNQTVRKKLSYDIWKNLEATLKGLASRQGKILPDQAAGTVTVRDHPENIRNIASYIDTFNAKVSRQVAIRVNVWQLTFRDESGAAFDMNILFKDGFGIYKGVLGGGIALGGGNSAGMSVIAPRSHLLGSAAMVSAMKEIGTVTALESASGIAMNNQPFPVINVTREAYLAGSSSVLSESGLAQTAITPGEMSYGFSMTLIPHIVAPRKVILQYSLKLTNRDGLEQFESGGTKVQLPTVSTRGFDQRVAMQMGQTLVLAGYLKNESVGGKRAGLLGFGRESRFAKKLLVITIELEGASPDDGVRG
jgi:type IVB pilus formation R64 PilN family outer membrane protein